jgi:uncharacterized protein (DUF58 family)
VSALRAPATAGLGAAVALVGLGLGLESVLLPGVALLLLAAVAYGRVELASRRGRLEREPLPRRVTEDEPLSIRIRLRGTLLRPPDGELSDPLLARPHPVGPQWPRELLRVVHLRGAGRRRITPSRIVIRDPIGLWSRELSSGETEEIVVLPRVEPVRSLGANGTRLAARGGTDADDGSSPAAAVAQFEIDGLRPYRQGSPASRIHWPSVARSGEMLERRMVGGGGSRPLVVLDPRNPAGPEGLQRALRAAASLCVALAAAGGCELLLPGERRPLAIDPALRSWPEAHVRLAVADVHAAPAPGPTRRSGTVFWVAAGPGRVRGLARGHGGFLVGPSVKQGAAGFRVAGLFGRRLAAAPRARPAPRRAA